MLDFEWAGVMGTAKYPLMMNHIDVEWPEDANPGKAEHDFYWANRLFSE